MSESDKKVNSEQSIENESKSRFRHRGKGIYLLPNLFTVSAMFSGFYAIIASFHHPEGTQLIWASVAIFIAMLLDSLDGRVARLTNTQTAFGAELDSLSDMVSFGIAPACLMYVWGLNALGKIGWLIAFVYAVAVALRLARFNVTEETSKRYFQGLACPAAAGVLAGLVWVLESFHIHVSPIFVVMLAVVPIFLAIMMITSIPYRSFKDLNVKQHVPFMTMLLVVLTLIFIAVDPPVVLFIVFVGYAISGPLFYFKNRKKMIDDVAKK